MATHHINREQAVRRLGQIYLINCTCTGAAGILISFIYDRIGLYNLGQTNLFMIYIGYSIASFYPNYILGFFREFKVGLFVGFFVNGLQILAAILTYSCYRYDLTDGFCSVKFLGPLNISVAFSIGMFASVYIWTGNFEFIARVSTNVEKKVMFAIFNTYLAFNNVLANFLNIVFYSYEVNSLVVFSCSYVIFMITTVSIYWYLPNIDGYVPEDDPQNGQIEEKEVELKNVERNEQEEKLELGLSMIQEDTLKEKGDVEKANISTKLQSSRTVKDMKEESFFKTVKVTVLSFQIHIIMQSFLI